MLPRVKLVTFLIPFIVLHSGVEVHFALAQGLSNVSLYDFRITRRLTGLVYWLLLVLTFTS